MSVESETKHVLDNLFCLDVKDGLHLYLTKQAKQNIAINDILMIGNKLLSGSSSYVMNDHETNLMNQLNDYDEHCFNNEINMDETFYLLLCSPEDFNKFKSTKTSSLTDSTTSTDPASHPSLGEPPHHLNNENIACEDTPHASHPSLPSPKSTLILTSSHEESTKSSIPSDDIDSNKNTSPNAVFYQTMDSSITSNEEVTSKPEESTSSLITSSCSFQSEEIESVSIPSSNGESNCVSYGLEEKVHPSHPSIPESSLKSDLLPTVLNGELADNEETTIAFEDYVGEDYGESTFHLFEDMFPSDNVLHFDLNEDTPMVSSHIVGRCLDSLSSNNWQCIQDHSSSSSLSLNIESSSHLNDDVSSNSASDFVYLRQDVLKLLNKSSCYELLTKASTLKSEIMLQHPSLNNSSSSMKHSILKLEDLLEDSLESIRRLKLKSGSSKPLKKHQHNEAESLIHPKRLFESNAIKSSDSPPSSISNESNKSSFKSLSCSPQFPSFNSDVCSVSSPITPHLKGNIEDYHQRLDKNHLLSNNKPAPVSEGTSTSSQESHLSEDSFIKCISSLNENDSEFNSPTCSSEDAIESSNLIASSLLESCFSFDSETSDELSLLENKDTCLKKRKSKIATFTSVLIATNLASNVKSSTSFRPKGPPSKAPDLHKTFPPLKKRESSSIKSSLSSLEPPSNLTSKFESSFKFHLDSCYFPASLIATSEEIDLKRKKSKCIKKKALKEMRTNNIFSKKKGSKSFVKILSSLDSFHPSTIIPGTPLPSDSSFNTSHLESCSPCHLFKRCPHDLPSKEDSPPAPSHSSHFASTEDRTTSSSSSKLTTKALLDDSSRFFHLISSRFESTRTMFNHVFKTSFEPTFTSSEEDNLSNHLHCNPSSLHSSSTHEGDTTLRCSCDLAHYLVLRCSCDLAHYLVHQLSYQLD